MGYTIDTSDPKAVKLWNAKLNYDTIMGNDLIADAMNDGIMIKIDDLSKGKGDRVRIPYALRVSSFGVIGDQPLRNTAANVNYAYDDVVINKLAYALKAKSEGSISNQRVAYDLVDPLNRSVTDLYKQRFIASMFNQLGGNTATSIGFDGLTYTGTQLLELTGMNGAIAPSINSRFYVNPTSNTTDEQVAADTTATLKLANIVAMEEAADTQFAGAQNFMAIDGKPYRFKLYISVKAWTQLWNEANATPGLITIQNTYQRVVEGSGDKDAILLGRRWFDYSMTRIVAIPDHYIPKGVNSTTSVELANARRALFCGSNAVGFALGRGYTDGAGKGIPGFKLVTENDDMEDEAMVGVKSIFGMKKAVVSGYDLSVKTLTHYVP